MAPLGLVLLEDDRVEATPGLVESVVPLAEPDDVVALGEGEGDPRPVDAVLGDEPLQGPVDDPVTAAGEGAREPRRGLGDPAGGVDVEPVGALLASGPRWTR